MANIKLPIHYGRNSNKTLSSTRGGHLVVRWISDDLPDNFINNFSHALLGHSHNNTIQNMQHEAHFRTNYLSWHSIHKLKCYKYNWNQLLEIYNKHRCNLYCWHITKHNHHKKDYSSPNQQFNRYEWNDRQIYSEAIHLRERCTLFLYNNNPCHLFTFNDDCIN